MSLRKYLSQFNKEQLIAQIIELSKKYKPVKEYYEFSINPDVNEKKEEVKEAVLECFYPKRGYKLRLKDARKAISEFKKLEPGTEALADIMVFFVECGVRFTNDFGDMDEPFYNSIAGMFRDAGKLIQANDLTGKFKERAGNIMEDTRDIGWGFSYDIEDVYYNYFEE